MAYMPDKEKERSTELLRRYNNPMPLDDLLAYVSSVYAEGRADERRECLKCVNEVQLNALKSQRLEVGKSQSGMDFQSGRLKGAEDAIAKIAARSALQITQDSLTKSYPEAEEAAVEAVEVVPEPEVVIPAEVYDPNLVVESDIDDDEADIIRAMQIEVTDEADEIMYDEDDEDEDDDDEELGQLILPEPEPEVVQERPKKKSTVAKKRSTAKKTKPKRR